MAAWNDDSRGARRTLALRVFALLAGLHYLISVALGHAYIRSAPPHDTLGERAYLMVALLSNTAILYLVPLLLLVFLVALVPRRSTLLFVAAPLLTLFQGGVLVDSSIYRIFAFHVNGMVLNLLATEGAFDSVHLGGATLALFSATLAGILTLSAAVVLWSWSRIAARAPARPLGFWVKRAAALMLAIVVADKATSAWGEVHASPSITRHREVFPLYLAPSFKRFMRERSIPAGDRDPAPSLGRPGAVLHYPKAPLAFRDGAPMPNIVWIVLDSWRHDMLDPAVTPAIAEFSRRCLVFNRHYAGGNATRFGIFGLFYGLYGGYWNAFLAERQGPVLLEALAERGYEFRILSATKLTFPEFDRTVFASVPPAAITDEWPGEFADTRDPEMVRLFDAWLAARDRQRPFFSFLFFNAPHMYCSYPDEFEKFRPALRVPNFMTLGPGDGPALLNSYRNALAFDDALVARLLQALDREGLLDTTAVLITGDHGSAYYEHGRLGYNTDFTDEQVRVPLVLWLPGEAPRAVDRLTSHLDAVPTFMDRLGCASPASDYAQGRSLLAGSADEWTVVSGWANAALLQPDERVVFSLVPYYRGTTEFWEGNYARALDPDEGLRRHRERLLGIFKGYSEFLRRGAPR